MKPYNNRITYFGVIRSISSWSKIAREMLTIMAKNNIVNIYERKGFLYNENFSLGILSNKIHNELCGDIILTFEHPKNYIYLPENKKNIGFLVYEFTRLPELWVENINKYLSLVFVPSFFNYKVFIDSGVEKEKIRILRYGINPEFYYPSKNKNQKLTFLCVGSPQKREGIDILLETFDMTFKENEDIKLILKLSYLPENPKIFEIRDFKGILSDYKNKMGNKLEIIDEQLTENQMGELYRKSDIYFSLSRAEAFGLPFLEAIACGKPVIAINYGGTKDFLNNENCYSIAHKIISADGFEYQKTNFRQFITMPYKDNVVSTLKKIYADKNNLKKPDLKEKIEYYFWEKIVSEFFELIG